MRGIVFLIVASTTTACSWIPTYISDPGVEIEISPTTFGHVASANFWTADQGVVLRGEIIPRPATKSPLFGHVHAVVNEPGAATYNCFRTGQRLVVRRVRKPYFLHFDQLPPPGNVLQVFYHDHSGDHGCAAAQDIGQV